MPNKTIKTYSKFAKQLSGFYEKMLDEKQINEFLKHLPNNGQILDVGCGSGRDSSYFVANGFKALGIDPSKGMLDEAQMLHPELPTQQMKMEDINFPTESFDGAWVKASLLHLKRELLPNVIQTLYSILKQRGILFIQTKLGVGSEMKKLPLNDNYEREFTLYTEKELEEVLQKTGFEVIKKDKFTTNASRKKFGVQDWIAIYARKI